MPHNAKFAPNLLCRAAEHIGMVVLMDGKGKLQVCYLGAALNPGSRRMPKVFAPSLLCPGVFTLVERPPFASNSRT